MKAVHADQCGCLLGVTPFTRNPRLPSLCRFGQKMMFLNISIPIISHTLLFMATLYPVGGGTTTGEKRTGCVFCAFGAHLEKSPNRFQRLKQSHPKLWEYCMKPIEEHGLGMRKVLEFIGVQCDWKRCSYQVIQKIFIGLYCCGCSGYASSRRNIYWN